MVKKSKDVVKDVVMSKSASKSTYGTDPKDPWSAKSNIDENITSRRADLLSKFYKSRGWNVNYISKNKKVSQSKTDDYDKWKRDHGIYEQGEICSTCQVDPCICDDSHGFANKEQVTEMDKSQTPPGRDGHVSYSTYGSRDKKDPDAGKKQYVAKAITPKETVKKATEILNKAFNKEEIAPVSPKQIRSTTSDSPTHKRMHQLNKAAHMGTIQTVDSPSMKTEAARMSAAVKLQRAWERERAKSDASKKRGDEYMAQIRQQVADKEKKEVKEDNFLDPKAATQCACDATNNPDDTVPNKKMSKAAKMVKELHSRKITEDMYDTEKSDKQGEQYGKAPKVKKTDGVNELGDKKPNARMVLKGGTTLTGQSRDMVEIDPMLKNRTSMPDYKSMDQKKTKPQEQ